MLFEFEFKKCSTMAELLSLSVHLDPDTACTVNKERLIESILAKLCVDKCGTASWDGETYNLVRNDRLKTELMRLFGSSVSLDQIDSNIDALIRDSNGYLQSRVDDSFMLKSGQDSADLAIVAKIVASTLSQDIVGTFTTLLTNLNAVLSSEDFHGKTSRVAANLYHTKGDDLLLVHARLDSEVSKRKRRVLIFGSKQRSVRLNIAVRKIGITKDYASQLEKGRIDSSLSEPHGLGA